MALLGRGGKAKKANKYQAKCAANVRLSIEDLRANNPQEFDVANERLERDIQAFKHQREKTN